jgi:hypothetical protein
MGEMRTGHKILVRKQKGRDHIENQDMDGRTTLKWILKKLGVRVWTGFTWNPYVCGSDTERRLLTL